MILRNIENLLVFACSWNKKSQATKAGRNMLIAVPTIYCIILASGKMNKIQNLDLAQFQKNLEFTKAQ